MDLKNVGISQFWKVSTYVQQASNIGQHYYPETMGKFYIIVSCWKKQGMRAGDEGGKSGREGGKLLLT